MVAEWEDSRRLSTEQNSSGRARSAWGAQGELVYNRTYSRPKPGGEFENWVETVIRVADGNLNLVDEKHQLYNERKDLINMMSDFKVIPAGRHLWASGVRGREYLFNCWVAGWGPEPWTHAEFTFMRLMEGGGVGANYTNGFSSRRQVQGVHDVHIVCDPEHPDYDKMSEAGVLSNEYTPDWGCFEVEDSREN